MITVAIAIMMATLFICLSVLYWKHSIGAGPTILLLGVLFLYSFLGIEYSLYQTDLRKYDLCKDRIELHNTTIKFYQSITPFFEAHQELNTPQFQDLKTELSKPPKNIECGTEPQFLFS